MPPSRETTWLVRYPLRSIAMARSATSPGAPAAHRDLAAQLARVAREHSGPGDQGRGESVHGHPAGREPAGQEVGQPVQPGLRGGVVRPDDPPGESGHRGDKQDPAEAALGHPRQDALGQQERGAQVDRDHLVEVGRGHLVQPLAAAQPRVADQDAGRAERVLGGGQQPARPVRAAQVGAQGHRPAARAGDLRRHPFRRIAALAVPDGDGRAGRGQPPGHSLAYAAAAPGDHRHPPGQPVGCRGR